MSHSIRPAPLRKAIVVSADPQTAFEVFTSRLDSWWPRTHTIGKGSLARAVLEPKQGGRWYGVDADGTETNWGDVLVWEPPHRLVLAWRIAADWTYDPDLLTEVEVTFAATGAGTDVQLEHRHLERMGDAAEAARGAFDSPSGWGAIIGLYATELADTAGRSRR